MECIQYLCLVMNVYIHTKMIKRKLKIARIILLVSQCKQVVTEITAVVVSTTASYLAKHMINKFNSDYY